jgi:hypothetical protein
MQRLFVGSFKGRPKVRIKLLNDVPNKSIKVPIKVPKDPIPVIINNDINNIQSKQSIKVSKNTMLNHDIGDNHIIKRRSKQLPKLRTSKTSLNMILIGKKQKSNKQIIFDAVIRTHQIVIHLYMFIRLFVLNKFHNDQTIPIINKDFLAMAIKSLVATSVAGPTPKGSNLALFNEFNSFYESDYKQLGYMDKINATNLSQILGYMETDIITNIENNIRMHFVGYVKQFVNSSFKSAHNNLIDRANKNNKKSLRKELKKDLYEIKQDLLNNTNKSDSKYHCWIEKHRSHIFPINFIDSYEFDLVHNPQKYLKHMIYMCIELEKIGGKSFQFFPIRSNIIPKYIPIDTATLIDLFISKDKSTYFNNVDLYKDQLWSSLLNISDPVFKQKHYTFDYRILTDGFAVSIQLINKNMEDEERKKKNNMKIARRKSKILYAELSQDEIEKIKNQKEKEKKEEKMVEKLKKKREIDKKKEEFKKLPKDEQKRQKEKAKKERYLKKQTEYIEFPYLDEMNDTEYELFKMEDNWVVVDPGKRTLLYMKNKKGECLKYSNRTHLHKTKRIKYQRLIQNYKKKNNIAKTESELSSYNSKSCVYKTFKKYIEKKNLLNERLLKMYEEEIFRKYKWYGYINRQRADSNLIKEIKKKFGEKPTIVYGDWSIGQQMKHMISTPNMRLKRKVGESFKIYTIDEYRTSCVNHKTLEMNENMYLPDKKGVIRKMHSILTYKMGNKRQGCINRDNNAVMNMITITEQYIKDRTRPEHFRRGVKLEEIKNTKGDNPEFRFSNTIVIY